MISSFFALCSRTLSALLGSMLNMSHITIPVSVLSCDSNLTLTKAKCVSCLYRLVFLISEEFYFSYLFEVWGSRKAAKCCIEVFLPHIGLIVAF